MIVTKKNPHLTIASTMIDRLNRGFRASDAGSGRPDHGARSAEWDLRRAMDDAKALQGRDPGAAAALYGDALREWERLKGER